MNIDLMCLIFKEQVYEQNISDKEDNWECHKRVWI